MVDFERVFLLPRVFEARLSIGLSIRDHSRAFCRLDRLQARHSRLSDEHVDTLDDEKKRPNYQTNSSGELTCCPLFFKKGVLVAECCHAHPAHPQATVHVSHVVVTSSDRCPPKDYPGGVAPLQRFGLRFFSKAEGLKGEMHDDACVARGSRRV